MTVFRAVRTFTAEDNGAITVDWVVLTAAVVGLSLTALSVVKKGTDSLSVRIDEHLSDYQNGDSPANLPSN